MGMGSVAAGLLLALVASACATRSYDLGATRARDDTPPNLLVFLVDDLGWHDTALELGPNRAPHQRRYRTPNLEGK